MDEKGPEGTSDVSHEGVRVGWGTETKTSKNKEWRRTSLE